MRASTGNQRTRARNALAMQEPSRQDRREHRESPTAWCEQNGDTDQRATPLARTAHRFAAALQSLEGCVALHLTMPRLHLSTFWTRTQRASEYRCGFSVTQQDRRARMGSRQRHLHRVNSRVLSRSGRTWQQSNPPPVTLRSSAAPPTPRDQLMSQ